MMTPWLMGGSAREDADRFGSHLPGEAAGSARWRFTLSRLAPGVGVLRHYRRRWLRRDVLAGLAVAAYLVPQVMAYAGLVGVPAVAGLWVAVGCLVVYAALGSSRRLSVGPESTVALLAGSVVGPLAHGDPARASALAATLALIVAGWLSLAWLARLGVIANLLSHPLLVGYLTGAAVLMAAGQLGRVTGTTVSGDTVLSQLSSFAGAVSGTNLTTLAVAVGTLSLLLAVHWWHPQAPAALVAVVLATVLSAAFHLSRGGVVVLGAVPVGLPMPHLPLVGLADVKALALAGLGVAVVAYSDNMLIGRAFSRRGDTVDANQELLALAGVHVAAGLMSGFPVSSSGSRTALAIAGRAKTQMYSLVAAALVLAVLVFAGPLLAALPAAALGAVVVYAAMSLIDVGEYRQLWRFRRSEFAVAAITCLGTLLLGILAGVGIAVALSILEMLAWLSRPHDAIEGMVPGVPGMHDVDDFPGAKTVAGLVVYRYDGPLFFANAANFHRLALAAVAAYDRPDAPVEWLVLNVEANMYMDITAAGSLAQLHDDLAASGVRLGLARVKNDLALQMDRAGLLDLVGTDMLFPTVGTAVAAFQSRHGAGTAMAG